MRPSAVANRTSHGMPANTHVNAAAKLIEKKKEFDAVAAFERASALYVERIEGLSDDCDIMAEAGEAHGQVLEQWPRMFQVLNLFLASREMSEANAQIPLEGQQLVRVPMEDIQEASSQQTQPTSIQA